MLLVTPKLPVLSLDELLAEAQRKPGRLNIASQGSGTISHLSAELLKSMAAINLTHVPYKGTAPAMTDLLGGQVELMFDNLITAMPYVKSGKLRLLGVAGERRIDVFPDVPAITEKLSAAVRRAVDEPDFRRLLAELQAEPVGNTPREMAEVVRQEMERWSKVIRDARISVQ